jgi:hypothetical protein
VNQFMLALSRHVQFFVLFLRKVLLFYCCCASRVRILRKTGVDDLVRLPVSRR